MLILKGLQKTPTETRSYRYGGVAVGAPRRDCSLCELTRGLFVARNEIELEIQIFAAFRDTALELGLQNAASLLTEQIAARKQALTKTNPQASEVRSSNRV